MSPLSGVSPTLLVSSTPHVSCSVLRSASLDDVTKLLTLEELCFGDERFNRRRFRYLLARPHSVKTFLVEECGEAIGYLLMLFRARSSLARIYSVAVHPSHRGKGLGELLVREAEQCASVDHKTKLSLEVRAGNTAAKGLYERLGFSVTTTLPSYYPDGEDGLRMTKTLVPHD